MQDQEYIQIQDDMPDTHYFVYRDRKYPINFDLFKYSSDYFKNNLQEIELNKYIQLCDKEQGDNLNLAQETIETFINYVHRKRVCLNNENIVHLHYLANKYEIRTLIESTTNYIKNHQNELVLHVLSIYRNDQNGQIIDTSSYEEILSEHFIEYINDDRLPNINFSIIYRLLNKLYDVITDDEIIDFLFKCLDRHGRKSSILFSKVDFNKSKMKHMDRLLNEYSSIFDFHYINHSLLETMYEHQNDTIGKMEELRMKQTEQEKIITLMKQQKDSQDEKLEEQKKFFINEINELKKSFEQHMQNIEEKMKSQNAKYKAENQQLSNKIHELTDEMNELKSSQNLIIENKKEEDKKIINELQNSIQLLNNFTRIMFSKLDIQTQLSIFNGLDNKYQLTIFNQLEIEIQQKIFNQLEPKTQIFLFNQIENQRQKSLLINLEEKEQFSLFSILDGETQLRFINEMNKIDGDNIKGVFYILSHFTKKIQNLKITDELFPYVFIRSIEENENKPLNCQIIGFSAVFTELIFVNEKMNLNEMQNHLENFIEIYFEIKYPSKNFDFIYNKILELKKSDNSKYKISICITGLKETDSKFTNDANISFVSLDSSITKITKSRNDGSFEECSSLIGVEIPSSVTTIEDYAFLKCISLTSILIPSSVTSIGKSAFYSCSSLTNIKIPSSVTSIGDHAFRECKSLTKIIISSSVTSIDESCFSTCTSLIEIDIPSSVTSIGNHAFRGCTSLSKATISSSLRSISESCFCKCSSLIEIDIPSSVTSIDNYAFRE